MGVIKKKESNNSYSVNNARAKVHTYGVFIIYLFDCYHYCQLHSTLKWQHFFLLSDSGAPPPLASTYYAHFIFIYWHSKIRTDSNGTFWIFWREYRFGPEYFWLVVRLHEVSVWTGYPCHCAIKTLLDWGKRQTIV